MQSRSFALKVRELQRLRATWLVRALKMLLLWMVVFRNGYWKGAQLNKGVDFNFNMILKGLSIGQAFLFYMQGFQYALV